MRRTAVSILFCISWCISHAQIPAGKILFSSGEQGSSELYIVNSDGTNERQLTHAGSRVDFSNCSDGRIAYMQLNADKKGYDLLQCNDAGEAKSVLLRDEQFCKPVWQPGGKLLAYEYYPENRMEVWVMNADGSGRHMLIPNARHPYWYADGSKYCLRAIGRWLVMISTPVGNLH